VIAVALALGLALTCATAAAQDRDECDEEQREVEKGKKKNFKTVIGPDGQKIFVIEKAFIVCGKIPRPTVIYAFQPSTINYEWENLKKDFIPLILETVQEAPF
jgi:hypothetical protein